MQHRVQAGRGWFWQRFGRPLSVALLVVGVGAVFAPAALAAAQAPRRAAMPTYVECSSTRENDNNTITQDHNPYTDSVNATPSLNNTWEVYYDTLRDVHDNALCQMRVVLRIFPPSGGGVYTPVSVLPEEACGLPDFCVVGAGAYSTQAYASYPNHFVGRGPWFTMDSGVDFSIESWDNKYHALEAFINFIT